MFFGHQVDNLAEPPLQHSLQHSLHPWLFQVKPHPEESFGHFLSRFRRANHMSSQHQPFQGAFLSSLDLASRRAVET